MRIWGLAVLAVVIGVNMHAAELELSACVFPDAPEMPEGATASEQTMGEASAAIRSYVGDTQAGLDCLSAAEESLGEEITGEQKSQIVAGYNAGVDEMTALVASFNEQIRAYKAR
jgi:hypothetical protein